MTRSMRRLRIRALLAAIVAAVPAVFLFWLSNRRITSISLIFLRREFRHLAYGLAVFLTITALAGMILWIGLIRVHGFSKAVTLLQGTLSWLAFKALHRHVFFTLAVGGALAFVLFLYAQTRYRIFSETSYPLAARRLFLDGKIDEARLICERYVQLYPQRRPTGAVRDPVCGSILELAESSGALYRYVREQEPSPYREGNLETPVGWDAKKAALGILERWAGGRK